MDKLFRIKLESEGARPNNNSIYISSEHYEYDSTYFFTDCTTLEEAEEDIKEVLDNKNNYYKDYLTFVITPIYQ